MAGNLRENGIPKTSRCVKLYIMNSCELYCTSTSIFVATDGPALHILRILILIQVAFCFAPSTYRINQSLVKDEVNFETKKTSKFDDSIYYKSSLIQGGV